MAPTITSLKDLQLQAAQPVIKALEHCSLPRATWHLDANERWEIVRDTLLGHAPYRGGLRPRDLPLDHDCRKLLGGVAGFHKRGPEWPDDLVPIDFRFGDWLYTFSALIQPLLCEEDQPSGPPVAHQAVYHCFREIRRALPRTLIREDAGGAKTQIAEDPDAGEFAKTCPILHRLIGAVGWSIKDWNFLHTHARATDPNSAVKKKSVANCAEIAKLGARVVMEHELVKPRLNLENLPGNQRKWMIELEKPDLRIVTAMTKSVQDYICRGKRHWLMRGASAFSAQALAFVRDTILEQHKDWLLLSDSDVVVSFVLPAGTTLNACEVMETMWAKWRNKKEFLERYPRLSEVPEVRQLDCVDATSAFPTISIRMSKPMSLMDLCSPPTRHQTKDEDDFESQAVRRGHPLTGMPTAKACSYVSGDTAMTAQPPAWLEERGDNDGMSKAEREEEAFGFTCLLWSLCGTTLRAHWFQNASKYQDEMKEKQKHCEKQEHAEGLVPGLRMMPVHHGEWLKWLDADAEALVFLKLDGDNVGHAFSSVPTPRRPFLSMELGRLVLERVRNATWAVIEQRVGLADARCRGLDGTERARRLRENIPVEGGTIPLPADMVYVGGDDIFFCLPESSVATFLTGFSGSIANDYPKPWQSLTFKFVSVTLPKPITGKKEITEEPQVDTETQEIRIHPKSKLMQDANLLASQLAGDALKKVAKETEHSMQTKFLEQLKAGWEDRYRFDCEIWEPELKPHSGAIDETVVHGVHVRLIPKPA